MRWLASFLARPAVLAWLKRRAFKTPYRDIVKNGDVYMRRWWLFNPYTNSEDEKSRRFNWLPSVRLHHIMRPDDDRHMHDHPWQAISFIVQGGYREISTEHTKIRCYISGMVNRIEADQFHAITDVTEGGAWTVFVMFGREQKWGFLVDGVKVYWKEYLAK